MLYQNILNKMVDKSKQILGSELIDVYLHGSMAMGCFQPDKSDIDLVIVIKNNITDHQKLEFMNEVAELNKAAPSKGIELSIVKETYCKEFLYPTPFELHFSNMHLQWFTDRPADYIRKMKGTDKDLAAHFTVIKRYGIVLYGKQIEDVFADVPRENYVDSIWSDIKSAKEEILEEPVYMILNLCRVTAFLKNDLVLSKKQGGEWALQNLSEEYQALISNALQSYAHGNEMNLDKIETQKFADDMLHMIRSMILDDEAADQRI